MGDKTEFNEKKLVYGRSLFLLSIRETLMEYFKGIEETVVSSTINTESISSTRLRHRYERDEYERRQPKYIKAGPAVLMSVERKPNEMVLFKNTLERSAELAGIVDDIEAFVKKYLPSVKCSIDTTRPRSRYSFKYNNPWEDRVLRTEYSDAEHLLSLVDRNTNTDDTTEATIDPYMQEYYTTVTAYDSARMNIVRPIYRSPTAFLSATDVFDEMQEINL